MSHFSTTGFRKPTKLISFFKKHVNEFIRVKIVIILRFQYEKAIFIVFYIKEVNKTVPSLHKKTYFLFLNVLKRSSFQKNRTGI